MVRINHLNFKNEEQIHNVKTIRAIHSSIAQLSLSISLYI
jgi:hypothetical protein